MLYILFLVLLIPLVVRAEDLIGSIGLQVGYYQPLQDSRAVGTGLGVSGQIDLGLSNF